MKLLFVAFVLIFTSAVRAELKPIDKTVLSNGKRLHLRIVEGRRDDIILFESGGGDDVRVWNDLLPTIAQTTGATLVTYDRPGFGESEVDPEHHGLMADMERLETALKELGYKGPYTLVAHSLGGFYATLFASRNPDQVRAAVLIDVNLACYFTDAFLPTIRTSTADLEKYKTGNQSRYYFSLDYEPMALTMRQVKFPASIPVIDFVAGRRTFPTQQDSDRWRSCHAAFASESGNRTEIVAYGAPHYIYRSNPALIVAAIDAAHAMARGEQRPDLMYSIAALNDLKRQSEELAHSQVGLNQWGYDLLRSNRQAEAVKVFELMVALYPESSNAWDSLGEGYEAMNDIAGALKSYRNALAKDPGAKHAAERIQALTK